MNKSQLEFGENFICPYCFTKIKLYELEMEKMKPKEIKDGIVESLYKIEQTIEKMKDDDSLKQDYEEIKHNISDIKEDIYFIDYMAFAPDIYYCEECHEIIMWKDSEWQDNEMIYPDICRLLPNDDMPDEIKKIIWKL